MNHIPIGIHVTGIFAHTSWSHKNQSIHGSLNIPFLYVSSCLIFPMGFVMGPWDHQWPEKKHVFPHLLTDQRKGFSCSACTSSPSNSLRQARVTKGVGGTDGNRRRPKIQSNWYWYNVYTFFSTYYLFIVHVFMVYIKYSVYYVQYFY